MRVLLLRWTHVSWRYNIKIKKLLYCSQTIFIEKICHFPFIPLEYLRLSGLQVTILSIKPKEDFIIRIYRLTPKANTQSDLNERQKLATGKLENLKKNYHCISCLPVLLHSFFILIFLWRQASSTHVVIFDHHFRASGGYGIPVGLFQILKDDAVKVLHSICQQIWKTQQWPQDWKRSVFIPIPKKGNTKECSNYRTIALISHTSKVMLKILQARF